MHPLGTGRNFPSHHYQSLTHFSFFFFHTTSWHRAKYPDTPLYRSLTDFSFLFFHATWWQRAKFPDTPFYRYSTDFSFFVSPRGTEQKSRHTAQSVPEQFLFFLTPLNGTEQKSSMHYSSGPHNSQNQTLKGTLFWRAQWNKLLTTCSHHEQE